MRHFTRLIVLASGLFLATLGWAGGVLDPKLQQKMANGTGPFEVIVTFKNFGAVNNLSTLGVNFYPLTTLPMAGALMTSVQINLVLGWPTVESIYFNDRLEYFNHDAGNITGAHHVQGTLGIKGNGTTILVIDSGIDATHPDLTYGSKVVENVKIVSDLGTLGVNAAIEGVINTDNTSGHGTHVSGTAAGSGTASANDARDPFYYRGVAPEASLVGVGAGETLVILHALMAFDYAIANKDRFGTDVITNSWGNTNSNFDPNNPISVAAYEAYRQGIVVTFAAGNEGPNDNTMSSYAINPWVIGVAAGDKNKNLADFSSRGEAGDPFEHPDITAPGVDITSTRAPGTPVGALGPVIDPNNPQYTLYYHTISGTSMATPFVAGTVALLLEANPHLSPDQIEEIITSTAEPMPEPFHRVGSGYINVRAAVEWAQSTVGNRLQFLAGDTRWSSQANWVEAEEDDANLAYSGKWSDVSANDASGGKYKVGQKKGGQKPHLKLKFFGRAVKLEYPTKSDGGVGEVFLDGQSRGTLNFYSEVAQFGNRTAFAGLNDDEHTLELRLLNGKIFLDKIYIGGQLFPANTQFVEVKTTYTGTMGPALNGTETQQIPFEVDDTTIQISAELSWPLVADLDLYLRDPNGNVVANDASLNNPETLSYWVDAPGTYTYEIVGFASVLTTYTLTSTLTKAVPLSKPGNDQAVEEIAVTAPRDFELFQNYPNPFNPETAIEYALPSAGHVQLVILNALGQEVARLVNGWQPAGRHRVNWKSSSHPSGVYFYRLRAGEFEQTRKMSLLR